MTRPHRLGGVDLARAGARLRGVALGAQAKGLLARFVLGERTGETLTDDIRVPAHAGTPEADGGLLAVNHVRGVFGRPLGRRHANRTHDKRQGRAWRPIEQRGPIGAPCQASVRVGRRAEQGSRPGPDPGVWANGPAHGVDVPLAPSWPVSRETRCVVLAPCAEQPRGDARRGAGLCGDQSPGSAFQRRARRRRANVGQLARPAVVRCFNGPCSPFLPPPEP